MKTFLYQTLTALYIAKSWNPCAATEDNTSRQLNVDYSVNATTFNMSDPLIQSNGTLIATNEIGSSVLNNSVSVVLLEYGCETELNRTGLEVELSNYTEYVVGGVYQWKIQVIPERISSNLGGMVNITNSSVSQGSSVGSLQFCTRVSTHLDDIQVGFYEGNYQLQFDFTNNTFSLAGVGIELNDLDDFSTAVDDSFHIDTCHCANFNCIADQTIQQNDDVVMCITPDGDGDPSVVKIANFNLRMTDTATSTLVYDPIIFGASTWDADGLTSVSEDPTSNTVMIKTPVIAQFFSAQVLQVDMLGNALLEFTSKTQAMTFASYGLTFGLELPDEDEPGCLEKLFALFF